MNPAVVRAFSVAEKHGGIEPAPWFHLEDDIFEGVKAARTRAVTPEVKDWIARALDRRPFPDLWVAHTAKKGRHGFDYWFCHGILTQADGSVGVSTVAVVGDAVVTTTTNYYSNKNGYWTKELPLDTEYWHEGGEVSQTNQCDWNQTELALAQIYRATGMGLGSTEAVGYIPTPSPRNKSRATKGKKPLYDWRTVIIKPAKPRAKSKGGTRSSPRPHGRRGHWRRVGPEGRTWIPAATVNKAGAGMIFHDYVVQSSHVP
jgi:hypothetical protein